MARYDVIATQVRVLRAPVFIAVLLLCLASSAWAEPYAGSPRADPLVRFMAWTFVCLLAVSPSLLAGLLASRARVRSRGFVATFAISFGACLGVSVLLGAVEVAAELVSLVLHVLF
jgi:hypothetical protein